MARVSYTIVFAAMALRRASSSLISMSPRGLKPKRQPKGLASFVAFDDEGSVRTNRNSCAVRGLREGREVRAAERLLDARDRAAAHLNGADVAARREDHDGVRGLVARVHARARVGEDGGERALHERCAGAIRKAGVGALRLGALGDGRRRRGGAAGDLDRVAEAPGA